MPPPSFPGAEPRLDAPASPARAAARGPFAVGLAQLETPGPEGRSLPVDVWYPCDPGAVAGRPEAPHTLQQPHEAVLEPEAAAGAFPLLLFSHGNSGLRQQSTFLTTHLASWGFVVAAPDHVGNTFAEMLGLQDEAKRSEIHRVARRTRPGDLIATLERVLAGGRFARIDAARIGAFGHSFGGWTALKMPRSDARVGPVCALAPASEAFVGKRAFEADELPLSRGVPSLIVAGADDVLVDLEQSVWPLYERLAAPRALVGVERCDHFHFCDGVEPLHGMHERTVRPKATRSTLPYAELLEQARVHRALRGVVTSYFAAALHAGADDPLATLTGEALTDLDPSLQRLDARLAREAVA